MEYPHGTAGIIVMNRLYKLAQFAILKTIWVNFCCLPFKQAIRLPIVLARGVRIESIHKNAIQFVDCVKVKTGVVRFGFMDLEWSYDKKSVLNIRGTLIFKGSGYHNFSPGLSLAIARGAVVEIGNNFSCSHNTRFTIFKSLVIGNDNMWSFDNLIMDTDAHYIFDENGNMISHNEVITFGNHVWLGCRNVILKGAKIPDGSIIGAGSVVTKSLDKENSIYVGNKLLREKISWNMTLNYD